MATNFDELIKRQEESFDKIKSICTNYRKDSASRKTLEYLETRLDALNAHWDEFESNHQVLTKLEDKNIGYFVDGIYNKLKTLYEETRLGMSQLKAGLTLQEVEPKSSFGQVKTSYSAVSHDSDERVQDLLRQQRCNFNAFQRIYQKINLEDLYEKWELEDVLDSLKSKWEPIDKLNWKLDYALQGQDTGYEQQYVEFEINYDLIKKQINKKIWNNAHYEKATPRVEIPEFSGNYTQWVSFKDLFVETIHSNPLISKAQKMQHLKSKLTGEAERLVRHLKTSAENYESCWEILQHRFDNRRLMFTSYMSTLMNIPTIQHATAFNLKKLHDVTLECLNGLNNIGIDTHSWDPIVVYLLSQKLDTETYNDYIKEMKSPRSPPELEEFITFIESRFIGFEGMRGGQSQKQNNTQLVSYKKSGPGQKSTNFNKPITSTHTFYTTTRTCPICKTDHVLMQCNKFLELATNARKALVTKLKLCENCLYSHGNKQCRSIKKCKHCNHGHHTLLHDTNMITKYSGSQTSSLTIPEAIPSTSKHVNSVTNEEKEVLLTTMSLKVKNLEGDYITMRALLDQGSQVSLLTERAAQRLRIPRQKMSAVVSGIGSLSGNCKGSVHLECKSIHSEYTFNVDALVIQKLISNLPSQSFDITDWEYLSNLKLADPSFNTSAPVDMLLGADIYSELILDGIMKSNSNFPIAQQTKMGWIISGNVKTFNCFVTLNQLQEITKFWETEEISDNKMDTDEETFCETYYCNTTQRQADGKYVVQMPMKPDFEKRIGKTRPKALAQYLQLEKKMSRHGTFSKLYKAFMHEYLTMGHMKPVNTIDRSDNHTYLPHHGVIREGSSTTRLRVVFNGSMPSDTKLSLNDLMYTGPNLQKDMLTLIINWRVHRYALTADVEKMYRNIMLHDDQQHLQTVLWRNSSDEPLQEMQLTTVTYGMKSAPYLAMRTLKQLAQDEGQLYPAAAEVLEKYFYMDDLVHGQDSIEDAKQLIHDLMALMKKGGFNLRKWACNEPAILQDLSEEQLSKKEIVSFKTDTEQPSDTKTLGLGWNPERDSFTFNYELPQLNKQATKRSMLSDVSKLYDPLGWLSPTTVKAKMLFQKLWISKHIGWDDPLPIEIAKEWEKLRKDLPNIKQLSLNRWLGCLEADMEIHGFCDASEKAYACVIYSRTRNDQGEYVITLIAAKTKVAPLNKKQSLPRLELCGALLLAKLIEKVKNTIKHKTLNIFCWSDSQVVLAWLQGNINRWERYVANRVKQITDIIPADRWCYVRSEENSADCATRGLSPTQLLTFNLWWEGPQWLKSPHYNRNIELYKTDKGKTTNCLVMKTADDSGLWLTILHKYNKLGRVIRVVSWILRFIALLRGKRINKTTCLSIEEMDFATVTIIKEVQGRHFGDEILQLKKTGNVPKKSNLLKLTPFLDENGIMRVKGRLQNALLPENTKHPIILPANEHFTQLVIDDAHKATLHGGARLTLAQTRQKYWIIGGNRNVKKQLQQCVRCHRFKPHKNEQIMAGLPKERVTPSRPFTNTGIDFTGHVDVKINKGKGVRTCKGYIAIFICMVTKAVHIELVSDLSTQTFLAALKRMCARRGTPKHIYSDNGSNFLGAARSLQLDFQNYKTFSSTEFNDGITQSAIEWHFNAPYWPTAGGLWEAAVKSMKYHLKRVLGEQKLTFEQFTTLLAEIEGCMNSRPLSPLSEDIDDLEYLTPGHFLVGGPILSLPHQEANIEKLNLNNRWRLIEQMNLHIWKRWSNDYLTQLQVRSKWQQPKTNLDKGKLVLIKDSNTSPGKWAMARVQETHPGSDGYVRVVTLKTQGGELTRPISKLVPLPDAQDYNLVKSEEITQISDQRTSEKRPNRVRKPKIFTTLLWMMMALMALIGNVHSSPIMNYKITPIEKDHPIYFDEIGNMQLIHDEWTLLIYYNLSTYWQTTTNINTYVNHIDTICQRMRHLPCESLVHQLRHELRHLSEHNALLLSQRLNRRKRGYFNGVGNLARTLFGVMDSEFAEKYERDIQTLQSNDGYLLDLLKNQTLIIEAENNIIKKSENFTRNQFHSIHRYLQQVNTDMTKIETRVETLIAMNDVSAASITASLVLTNLNRIQEMLLRVLSDIYKGHLDVHLLPISQLSEQLNIISGKLPRGLSLPIQDLQEDLQDIYNLLYVKARVTRNYLLFELHLPLISDEEYTIYRVIPLTFNKDAQLKIIRGTSSHVAVNLLKNTYIEMQEKDLQQCSITSSKHLICAAQKPVYNLHNKDAPCEAKVFSQQTSLSCVIDGVQCTENWVKLHQPNLWLFTCCKKNLLRVICEEEVSSVTLFGTGLISLRQGCLLQREEATIHTFNHFGSQLNLRPDVEVPDLNTTINNMVNLNWKVAHLNMTLLERPPTTADIALVEEKIAYQKERQKLPATETINYHDVYHYTVTTLLVAGALCAIVYFLIRRQCARPQTPSSYVPKAQAKQQDGIELQVIESAGPQQQERRKPFDFAE